MQYKKFRNEEHKRCREAQNNWIEGKCKQVETLFRTDKVNAAPRKIRENFGERRIDAKIVRDKTEKR